MFTALIRTPRLRATLASNGFLRAIALPLLRACDWPITIRNPYAKRRFSLLSFTHKGYWFYGRARESATMQRFQEFVRPGDTVFEVGGHIGFITQFFATKVGHDGEVHVFEPGTKNKPFLRKNIASLANCAHIDAAVSDQIGKAYFYEENLGGFMNSLDANFARGSGLAAAQRTDIHITPRKVRTVTLDHYAQQHGRFPDFIKIDVEGAELAVLRGATKVLANVNALMVEVARDKDDIFQLLSDAGFSLSDENGVPLNTPADLQGNVFALRSERV
jgi:FkbM family methyltransferase